MSIRSKIGGTALATACLMGLAEGILHATVGDTHIVYVPATNVLAYGPQAVTEARPWATGWWFAAQAGLVVTAGWLLIPARTWLTIRIALRRR